ncbi:MAG: hypothetical protein WAO02_03280 [Verrucomicrobiia bacterium]
MITAWRKCGKAILSWALSSSRAPHDSRECRGNWKKYCPVLETWDLERSSWDSTAVGEVFLGKPGLQTFSGVWQGMLSKFLSSVGSWEICYLCGKQKVLDEPAAETGAVSRLSLPSHIIFKAQSGGDLKMRIKFGPQWPQPTTPTFVGFVML